MLKQNNPFLYTVVFILLNKYKTMNKLQNKMKTTDLKNIQGVHVQGKSQGKKYFFKVRELSGSFDICQGNLEFKQKSGKSQGVLK